MAKIIFLNFMEDISDLIKVLIPFFTSIVCKGGGSPLFWKKSFRDSGWAVTTRCSGPNFWGVLRSQTIRCRCGTTTKSVCQIFGHQKIVLNNDCGCSTDRSRSPGSLFIEIGSKIVEFWASTHCAHFNAVHFSINAN